MTSTHSNDKPLTVYKASAGSGKTFTLTLQYIKLLIQNPQHYRSILAVTFTNKATEEMKHRILSKLYGIAHQLPDAADYMDRIVKDLNLSQQAVSKNAAEAMSLLIHNYNYFKVETIDAFFQQVLRNIARELDLNAKLKVSLNDNQIEEKAVDEIIENLRKGSQELDWIIEYIRGNMDEEKQWNVIADIKTFGRNIFKDYYKEHSKEIDRIAEDANAFSTFSRKMQQLMADARNNLIAIGTGFFSRIAEHGYSESTFASNACGFYSRLRDFKKEIFDDDKALGATGRQLLDNPEKWLRAADRKKNPDADLLRFTEELTLQLNKDNEKRRELVRQYYSAMLTKAHLNQLRLLHSIEKMVEELNRLANRFQLSNTQSLLNQLIDKDDSPFIYEKIGGRLRFIMIDEFQDTGRMQWENFKVLLKECISRIENIGSIIVGDVKQSIYRWRDGDWKLLNDIDTAGDFFTEQLDIKPLQTNYRSSDNIIQFNNAFFEAARQLAYDNAASDPEGYAQLAKAYADVEQLIPAQKQKQNRGLVEVRLLPQETYDEQTLSLVEETVRTLLKQGARQKDIAILARKNDAIQLTAAYLAEHLGDLHVNIVSDEAFRLDSSVAVCMLVNAFRVMVNEDEALLKANLAKDYQVYVKHNEHADEDLLSHARKETGRKENDRPIYSDSFDELLPNDFRHEDRLKLQSLSVYDLSEELIRRFQLNSINGQSAYLCVFLDKLNEYLTDNTANLNDVIREYDENICKVSIQVDNADGIRMLTIHKSKGLEFPHVIIPFCDWTLERDSNTIWCSPTEQPYSDMPLIPVDYQANRMQQSIYRNDYYEEHLQNIVDNLNLLYVAFTRAGSNLFVYGKADSGQKGRENRSELIAKCLDSMANEKQMGEIEETEKGEKTYRYGRLYIEEPDEKEPTASLNVFNQSSTQESLQLELFDNHVQFRQSNQSRDFLMPEDETKRSRYIEMGNILHQLFSHIRTLEDIEPQLNKMEADGILYDHELTPAKLKEVLQESFRSPVVREWFSPKWTLYNECNILSVDPQTHEVVKHRPDRVMTDGRQMIVVDFKFGNRHREYESQVRQYMTLLAAMGHEHVQGFLWFVRLNEVVEVKL